MGKQSISSPIISSPNLRKIKILIDLENQEDFTLEFKKDDGKILKSVANFQDRRMYFLSKACNPHKPYVLGLSETFKGELKISKIQGEEITYPIEPSDDDITIAFVKPEAQMCKVPNDPLHDYLNKTTSSTASIDFNDPNWMSKIQTPTKTQPDEEMAIFEIGDKYFSSLDEGEHTLIGYNAKEFERLLNNNPYITTSLVSTYPTWANDGKPILTNPTPNITSTPKEIDTTGYTSVMNNNEKKEDNSQSFASAWSPEIGQTIYNSRVLPWSNIDLSNIYFKIKILKNKARVIIIKTWDALKDGKFLTKIASNTTVSISLAKMSESISLAKMSESIFSFKQIINGTWIAVTISSAITVGDYFYKTVIKNEEGDFTDLLAELSINVPKAALGFILAGILTTVLLAVIPFTLGIVGVFAVGALVSIGVGWLINLIDEKLEITETWKETLNKLEQYFRKEYNEHVRSFEDFNKQLNHALEPKNIGFLMQMFGGVPYSEY